MLVIFPAGEVSHFRWKNRTVTDAEWNIAVARLAGMARVPVVPAYVEGTNSLLFQIGGIAHPGFRTAMLGRELLNKRGRRIEVRVGAPIPPDRTLTAPRAV